MRQLYTLLWYLVLPLIVLRLLWVSVHTPAYRERFAERFGFYRRPLRKGCVWIHAVSVGETLAAAPLIRALLERYPDTPLLVTSTTPTGSEQVRLLFGERVTHAYWPWDLPGAVERSFQQAEPSLVVLLETELWPNLIRAAERRGVPVLLVNGRLSAKSHRGYARWRSLIQQSLSRLSLLAVQTAAEAERFIDLGASAERVVVTGNIKFDLQLDEGKRAIAEQLRAAIGNRPVWIAASTHAGEDEIALAAHRQVLQHWPTLLLILVPRHQERFDQVVTLAKDEGLVTVRRSSGDVPTAQTQVYLADTMGELLALYGACDIAFVGGSLVPVGGHNLLEPAAWEKPVLSGPVLHNFTEVSALLTEANALQIVDDTTSLAAALQHLLADPVEAQLRGERAAAVVNRHRGALQKLLNLLQPLIAPGAP